MPITVLLREVPTVWLDPRSMIFTARMCAKWEEQTLTLPCSEQEWRVMKQASTAETLHDLLELKPAEALDHYLFAPVLSCLGDFDALAKLATTNDMLYVDRLRDMIGPDDLLEWIHARDFPANKKDFCMVYEVDVGALTWLAEHKAINTLKWFEGHGIYVRMLTFEVQEEHEKEVYYMEVLLNGAYRDCVAFVKHAMENGCAYPWEGEDVPSALDVAICAHSNAVLNHFRELGLPFSSNETLTAIMSTDTIPPGTKETSLEYMARHNLLVMPRLKRQREHPYLDFVWRYPPSCHRIVADMREGKGCQSSDAAPMDSDTDTDEEHLQRREQCRMQ
jgi:hypothetical protein